MNDNNAYKCAPGKTGENGVAPQEHCRPSSAVKLDELVKRVAGEVQRQLNNEDTKRDEE